MSDAKTYAADLAQFLTDTGSVAAMPGAAIRLAHFFGSIVVYATTPLSREREPVKCRNHSGKKPCFSEIEIRFQTDSGAIAWLCPGCGENGTLSNWKGTIWDRRNN